MSNSTDGMGALKRAAERGPRRTALRVVLFLIIAAGAATLAAVILTRYVEARTAAARIPTQPVVVAAVELPEATTLRAEALTVVQWPSSTVPEGTSPDPAKLVGRVVRSKLLKGEPVLEARLAATDAGHGLAAILPAGMRAVAVRVDDVVGVAGFVYPGDTVDVIVTIKPQENVGNSTSKIILQNVPVLAVGKQLERNDRSLDKAVSATVATLMVDSDQSEKLALAASRGQILLTLRSGVDKELVDTRGATASTLLTGHASAVEPPPQTAAAPAKPAPHVRRVARAPEPPKERQVVEILRGDMFERRDFDKGSHR